VTLTDLIVIGVVVFVLFNVVLTAVLGVIYAERKVLARLQQRVGPSRTGPFGLLQTVADAIKLMIKEDVRPAKVDLLVFYLAPILVFAPIFMVWVALPFSSGVVLSDLDLGLFYVVAILGLSVVGMVLAGWASNNKYALLGSARSAAQLISYELPLVLAVLSVGIIAQLGTDRPFSLSGIVEAQSSVPYIVLMPLGFFLFMIGALAETSRIPFDIPMAEEEIVGGAMVEYSGIRWGVFFLAEYAGLMTMAFLGSILFLGGWNGPFSDRFVWLQPLYLLLKVGALILVVFWIRAPLPRLRIDQLMAFAWKLAIPAAFLNLLIVATGVFLARQLGWSDLLTGLFVLAVSALVLAAIMYGLAWRRERRLAQFRERWAQ
jgi:NADH-quinone oxidoreductase subunit H